MPGELHREIGKMNWWRATIITVIILISLVSCCTALRFKGTVFRGAVKSYVTSNKGLAVPNAAIGSWARSKSIGSAMQQLREEDQAEMSHSLEMSISTLAVLDIGGGVLFPVVQNVIHEVKTNKLLADSRAAFLADVDPPKQLSDFLTHPEIPQNRVGVKYALLQQKGAAQTSITKNLNGVGGKAGSGLTRKFTKIKKLFRLKSLGKALGPVFDVINIGFSIDSLVRTSMDCHRGPTCHVGGLVSASLGIVSGVVGIIALAVPVLAPLALVLGIAASLIEIFWQPPKEPLPDLHLEERRYDLNAAKIRKMDVYSRMQLQAVDSFVKESGEISRYIYVVNQGHFPNWMEENIADPEEMLSGPLTFGLNEEAEYDNYGIYKSQIQVKGQCKDVSESFSERSGDTINPTAVQCDYFQEGNGDLIVNSRFEDAGSKLYVGPDFYGISQSPRHQHGGGDSMYATTDGNAYRGVMILVPTDRVTNRELVGEEGPETYTTPVRTRGLHINTEWKLREKGLLTSETQYDDIVAIGEMHNLGYKVEDGGHMVIIDTGNSGRDVLVIDGWVMKLEARLGLNHNTLSFRTISRSQQRGRRASKDESERKNEIKGIKFNPGSGQVVMLGYDKDANEEVVEHELGHVRGVGILGASPFRDEITLFALQKDQTNLDDHFTVFKYTGTATYIFDAKNYKSSRFDERDEVHFKVLDGSTDCVPAPLLKIINMHNTAEGKDVQYKNKKVYIYSNVMSDDETKKPFATISFATTCPAKVSASNEDGHDIFAQRLINDLDIMHYTGQRFDHDFSRETVGATEDDIVYLQCPAPDVAANNPVTNVKTVVVDDAFFDECEIGSGDTEWSGDGLDITVTWSVNSMHWNFPATESGRVAMTQTFTGVQKLVNRFNTGIVDLNAEQDFSLYGDYLKVTGKDMVHDSGIGEGVKDNLNMCILKETNLAAMKRGALPRETEFTANDIKQDCA